MVTAGPESLRALYERIDCGAIEIVAINDLASAEINAHLTEFDTHGKFPGKVMVYDGALIVNGNLIRVLAERNPAKLPWTELSIDVVLRGSFSLTKSYLKSGVRYSAFRFRVFVTDG